MKKGLLFALAAVVFIAGLVLFPEKRTVTDPVPSPAPITRPAPAAPVPLVPFISPDTGIPVEKAAVEKKAVQELPETTDSADGEQTPSFDDLMDGVEQPARQTGEGTGAWEAPVPDGPRPPPAVPSAGTSPSEPVLSPATAPPPSPQELIREIVTEEEKKRVLDWKLEKLKAHQAKQEQDRIKYFKSYEYRVMGKWRSSRNGNIQFYKDGTGYIVSPVVDSTAIALSGRYFFRYKIDGNILTIIPILTRGAGERIVAYFIIETEANKLKLGPIQYVKEFTE